MNCGCKFLLRGAFDSCHLPLTSWPRFGADRTPSPDVRSGHPGLRSLDADCAPASCLRRPIRLRRIGARATPALGARPAPHGFCSLNKQLQRARGSNLLNRQDETCHHKRKTRGEEGGCEPGFVNCGCKFSTCTCLRHDGIVWPRKTRENRVATRRPGTVTTGARYRLPRLARGEHRRRAERSGRPLPRAPAGPTNLTMAMARLPVRFQ